jgi:hypothetical protein
MAQQRQWTVKYSTFFGPVVDTYTSNESRLNEHYQLFYPDGTIQSDLSVSFAFREVQLGDPIAFDSASDGRVVGWTTSVTCRQNPLNGGRCIDVTDNKTPAASAVHETRNIFFNTKDDVVAFLGFFRK